MLLVDDLAAGGTKNLRHTPRGLVTLLNQYKIVVPLFGAADRFRFIQMLHSQHPI